MQAVQQPETSYVDEGFGVGHTRKTQTKGIWMWGSPMTVPRGDGEEPLNLLLFDTEGFEATGKADAYDDRIFALSTIVSAVLIYNLPETIRESDLQVISSVPLSYLHLIALMPPM